MILIHNIDYSLSLIKRNKTYIFYVMRIEGNPIRFLSLPGALSPCQVPCRRSARGLLQRYSKCVMMLLFNFTIKIRLFYLYIISYKVYRYTWGVSYQIMNNKLYLSLRKLCRMVTFGNTWHCLQWCSHLNLRKKERVVYHFWLMS